MGRCDTSPNFGFFVFGDVHTGPTNFNATLQIAMGQMAQIDANAVAAFSNGDVVDFPSEESWAQHDTFMASAGFHLDTPCISSFGAKARYFASVGDHDCDIASWYGLWSQHLAAAQGLGYHAADGVYYSVRYANALFVMLDSEHLSSVQDAWLQSTLASSDAQAAQLKFVFTHEPVYSCNSRHAPLAGGLPWVDLAEQHGVDVVFGSHTHVYTRSCPKRAGKCTGDATGVVFIETGAVGGEPRQPDLTTGVVTGVDASGNARTDAYDCIVGQDLMAANGPANDFCHVQVEGCQARVDCYLVGEGNSTPFDSWTASGCP